MRTIKVYEFKDLAKNIQEEVFNKAINGQVEFEIEMLGNDLEKKRITEKEYYDILGCSKSYAETTSWFIPNCYYEKSKKRIDEVIGEMLENEVFTERGKFIQ